MLIFNLECGCALTLHDKKVFINWIKYRSQYSLIIIYWFIQKLLILYSKDLHINKLLELIKIFLLISDWKLTDLRERKFLIWLETLMSMRYSFMKNQAYFERSRCKFYMSASCNWKCYIIKSFMRNRTRKFTTLILNIIHWFYLFSVSL